jgi:cell division septation protein DedD
MSAEQRCSIGVQNIELLCDLEWRCYLMLGAELSKLKWSGDFTRDSVWRADETSRSWTEWLKRRDFRLSGGEKAMSNDTANALIMWSVLYANFVDINKERVDNGKLPLPLPTSVSQLRPYAPMMKRVDDWVMPDLVQGNNSPMQPPFAEEQPEVIAAWEKVCDRIDPEKRVRKGELRPPTESESDTYFSELRGLEELEERRKKEEQQQKEEEKKEEQTTLTIGEKPADPNKQAEAAAAKPKAKPMPTKTAAEIAAEKRQYQIESDVREYRLLLHNLQASVEAVESFIKSVLARERSEAYLQELRQLDLGIYSVTNDVGKLRDAVVVCQSVYKLITEPYVRPEPISRYEVDPRTVTIET